MTRFTDKLSVLLVAAFLGIYSYAVFAQSADIFGILNHLFDAWGEQMFPLAVIAAVILVTKVNFVLKILFPLL